jgi:hypothetical protein
MSKSVRNFANIFWPAFLGLLILQLASYQRFNFLTSDWFFMLSLLFIAVTLLRIGSSKKL